MNITITAVLEPAALQGNIKLAVSIFFGMMLGILLVKCDFAERQTVKNNLVLSNVRLSKTLLLTLGLGLLIFSLLQTVHVVQSNLPVSTVWGVILGGILTGIGLGIGGLVPVTAVSALASGKLYAIWVLLGMILAIPAARIMRSILPGVAADSQVITMSIKPGNGIFSIDSPVLWISTTALALCVLMTLFGGKDEA